MLRMHKNFRDSNRPVLIAVLIFKRPSAISVTMGIFQLYQSMFINK